MALSELTTVFSVLCETGTDGLGDGGYMESPGPFLEKVLGLGGEWASIVRESSPPRLIVVVALSFRSCRYPDDCGILRFGEQLVSRAQMNARGEIGMVLMEGQSFLLLSSEMY
jgi:hypothetical protein